ncbi:MAG: A24 family peptidase [Isosphaeraceae bacterium]
MQVPQEVIWLVSIVMIEAAVIDGMKLKVPNWLTFHMIAGGLAFSAWHSGSTGLLSSIEGTAVGLAVLLPLYSIGGMGAGDVKLMAGVGAWVGPWLTLQAFIASALVGGIMAVVMVAWTGRYARHWAMFQTIGNEILSIRNPVKLSEIATERKPTMLLLPYGIPMAVGTIAFFIWAGLMF